MTKRGDIVLVRESIHYANDPIHVHHCAGRGDDALAVAAWAIDEFGD